MLDKQKLLQWIEDMKFVYSVEDGDSQEYIRMYKGMLKILNTLDMDIRAGNLDVEEVAHERSEVSSVPSAS